MSSGKKKHVRHVSFLDDEDDKEKEKDKKGELPKVTSSEGKGAAGTETSTGRPPTGAASSATKHTPPRKSAAERKMEALLNARGHHDSTPAALRKTLKKLTLSHGAQLLKPGTLSAVQAAKMGQSGIPMPSVEDLLQELDNLYEQLLKKDEDLKLAGTIGQALLERNEEAMARIAELEKQAELHEKEVEQLRALQRQEERKCKRYQSLLQEHEKRYEDLVEDNRRLRELWEQEKAKSQRDAASLSTAEEEAEARINQLRQTVSELNAQISRLQEENAVLVQSLKRDQEQLFRVTAELEDTKRALEEAKADAAAARAKIPKEDTQTSAELKELQWQNQQLTRSLNELKATIDRMKEKQEEDARQLAAARQEIEKLEAALGKKQGGGADEQAGWSLAEDMQAGEALSSPPPTRPRMHSGYAPTTVSTHRASVHRSSKSISGSLAAAVTAAVNGAPTASASAPAPSTPSHSRTPSLSVNTGEASPVSTDVSSSVQSAKERLAALKKRVEMAKAQRATGRKL